MEATMVQERQVLHLEMALEEVQISQPEIMATIEDLL